MKSRSILFVVILGLALSFITILKSQVVNPGGASHGGSNFGNAGINNGTGGLNGSGSVTMPKVTSGGLTSSLGTIHSSGSGYSNSSSSGGNSSGSGGSSPPPPEPILLPPAVFAMLSNVLNGDGTIFDNFENYFLDRELKRWGVIGQIIDRTRKDLIVKVVFADTLLDDRKVIQKLMELEKRTINTVEKRLMADVAKLTPFEHDSPAIKAQKDAMVRRDANIIRRAYESASSGHDWTTTDNSNSRSTNEEQDNNASSSQDNSSANTEHSSTFTFHSDTFNQAVHLLSGANGYDDQQ